MRREEVVPALEAALKPLLEEAGFTRDGDRWRSRRGDASRSLSFATSGSMALVCAEIAFGPAQPLLRSAPRELDLRSGTIPASELFQLHLHRSVDHSGQMGMPEGLFWDFEKLPTETLAAAVANTFRTHVLPFFEDTSTVEAALLEVEREGRHGDCGPESRYEPRINKFALAAWNKSMGDPKRALEVVAKGLAIQHPTEPWPGFRDWISKP